ncbi:hypothetical protein, partial [Acinetobacter baumannii]|uniref:hypothetical protein n=1 Tax=Acinetobacter baumannii TaxID=470 RepID=UPI0002AEBF06
AQVNCLSQQTKQKLSQDNLFPSLLSLLDVNTQVINPQLDEPYRVCRRVNILRDYPDDKTKLYPRN